MNYNWENYWKSINGKLSLKKKKKNKMTKHIVATKIATENDV